MDPVAIASSFWLRYGSIIAGVLMGWSGRYGLMLNEGLQLTWRLVLGDILLLGLVGLIAVVFADGAGLTGNARVLVAALAAVSSPQVARIASEQFIRRFKGDAGASGPDDDAGG